LFLSSDFFSLSLDMEMTLGKTMIELVSEEQIEPDSYKILGPFDVPKGTKRIGIMADFIDIEVSVWRDTIAVEEVGETNEVVLLLLDGEIRLVEKEE
jgi:type VI secretion system protein VasD